MLTYNNKILSTLLVLAATTECGLADETFGFNENPVLALRPAFASSLPVQILLIGIVFTLTAVLLIHLIFTAQYHWPLAPLNYALQLSSVITLFVSLIASIQVIFTMALKSTQEWPYMIAYISVQIPPLPNSGNVWSTAELASWYVMDATTSALVQITHIQFLTLLYPSQLEGRLILSLLGPLAVVSAGTELLPIYQNMRVKDIADTIRNTCNATLSLLFTAALLIWGFKVNRRQAWRTDGGTAAFGAGALALAVVSTALNFLYIPTKDHYHWMPRLIWAVVLWQSFLGWWWWVGGGMGVGEVEELLKREERREKKRKARLAKRTERKEKAQQLWRSTSEALRLRHSTRLHHTPTTGTTSDSSPSPPHGYPPASQHANTNTNANAESQSITSTTVTSSSSPPTWSTRLLNTAPLRSVRSFLSMLRNAHIAAAHMQALERVERRHQAYGAEAENARDTATVVGWGLGSFGIRERERRAAEGVDREDMVSIVSRESGDERSLSEPSGGARHSTGVQRPPRPSGWSMWWWGPLRRWRLQDSTAY